MNIFGQSNFKFSCVPALTFTCTFLVYFDLYIFSYFQVSRCHEFVEEQSLNANFYFWWSYLEMVSILLMFTRAQHDGIWDLHCFHSDACCLIL